MIRTLQEMLSLDLRSLALFRIGLGIVIIADLIYRAFDLAAHYTDFGVLPRGALISEFMNTWQWSAHLINGERLFIEGLFLLAGIFAFLLAVGYKTRMSTVLSWLLLVSLHNRNPMVLQGGDEVLRMLLLWSCFLPLGARFSVDSAHLPTQKSHSVFSAGTAGYFIQIALIYIINALLKTGRQWLPDGTAVFYALSIDAFRTGFGAFLLLFPQALKIVSWAIRPWYFAGIFLLFLSFRNFGLRIFTIAAFMSMHILFGLSMVLGTFTPIMICAFLPFIPAKAWELNPRIAARMQGIFHTISMSLPLRKTYAAKTSLTSFGTIIGVLLIAYILLWNMQHFWGPLKEPAQIPAMLLRLDQRWAMFSPGPPTDDGWYIVLGVLNSSRQIDVKTGKDVSYVKPASASAIYSNQRWQKYMMNLYIPDHKGHLQLYAGYLCRSWNRRHYGSESLDTLTIIYMKETTLPDYRSQHAQPIDLWRGSCIP